MKKLFIFMWILTFFFRPVLAKNTSSASSRLIIKYKNNARAEGTLSYLPQIQILERSGEMQTQSMTLKNLRQNDAIEYVEEDSLLYMLDAAPNDSAFREQWALENTGQSSGTADIDINANMAWTITKGSPDVVVMVIDTGFNYYHPDLAPNIWVNPREIPGNGTDDDHNGVIDDIHGCNFLNNSGSPLDDNGHGSHVSGSIAAVNNNGIGISGVAPNIKIAACKFLTKEGSGNLSDAIKAIHYTIGLKRSGVRVIATSNSYGSSSSSLAFQDAIKALQKEDILFIAAAGNESSSNDIKPLYPASYKIDNVISVAAIDNKGELATFSNYGVNSVHIAAPGVGILSTVLASKYDFYSGTSMATPHVAGVAALVASAYPHENNQQIKNRILQGVVLTPTLKGKVATGGYLRAADGNGRGALSCHNQLSTGILQPSETNFSLGQGSSIPVRYKHLDCGLPVLAERLSIPSEMNSQLELEDLDRNGIYEGTFAAKESGKYLFTFPDKSTLSIKVIPQQKSYTIQENSYAYIELEDPSKKHTLVLKDESVDAFKAPFPIIFGTAQTAYDMIYVASNGTISLTNAFVSFAPKMLPISSLGTLLAPFWADFNPNSAAIGTTPQLAYAVIGEAPHRKLIIEWKNLPIYGAAFKAENAATFEAIFSEDSTDIVFNYKDAYFGNTAYDYGKTALVGCQSEGNSATIHSFRKALLKNNYSLMLSQPPL